MRTPASLVLAILFGLVMQPAMTSTASAADMAESAQRSIKEWTPCNSQDNTEGLRRALAAARHRAFTLVVDCPLRLKIGIDIARPIFIDEGTRVEFSGTGKLVVDNLFIPAFVIADSSDVTLLNWNVEYDAGLPVSTDVGGFEKNGQKLRGPQPANAFNDLTLTPWLAANRGVVFDKSQGNVNAKWNTVTNSCAVFFLTGDSSNIRISGMTMAVPQAANGERFIPVAFSLTPNVRRAVSVNAKTPYSGEFFAVPHDVTFADITLDGTYMGWVGGVRDAVFERIRSHRYGDLQDARGGTVGGVGKWFAPPHLFYLSYVPSGDPLLFNKNIRIKDVVDDGPRVGTPRDKGGNDSVSGYALSLKLGCVDCSVDNYKSTRPDGFMDVLQADGMTVSNVDATYDSGFLNNVFPGWRFPSNSYRNVKFENVEFRDTAPVSLRKPIGDAGNDGNQNLVFKNVHVTINQWKGPESSPLPKIAGHGHDVSLRYSVQTDRTEIVRTQKGTLGVTLESVRRGPGAVTVNWTSEEAGECEASGAMSGALKAQGSNAVAVVKENPAVTVTCRGTAGAVDATVQHHAP